MRFTWSYPETDRFGLDHTMSLTWLIWYKLCLLLYKRCMVSAEADIDDADILPRFVVLVDFGIFNALDDIHAS